MKRLFLISLLVLATASLFAQEKGNMMISGSLSFSTNSIKDKVGSQSEVYKGDRNFSIIPEFHYFVADKWSVGLGIGYSLNKTPNDNGTGDDELFNKLGQFQVQPIVSYYVSLGNNFYYVPRFFVSYGIGKYKEEKTSSSTDDYNVSGCNFGLSVFNFEFKPTEKVGICFSAGDLKYQTSTFKHSDDDKESSREFSLGLNLGATIGFNLYF